jgi:uncharacterized membrane protein YhaH (DUF805 family)
MNDMSPIDWALRPLRHYAAFEGRSPRQEYWWFALFQWLAYIALAIIFFAVAADAGESGGPGSGFWTMLALFLLLILALFLPNLAVMIRRLHDQNLSGWYALLFFIPYVGGIVAIVFMCIPGTKGPNRFGRDPYEVEDGYLEQVFT